jgi:hypothetical protein
MGHIFVKTVFSAHPIAKRETAATYRLAAQFGTSAGSGNFLGRPKPM